MISHDRVASRPTSTLADLREQVADLIDIDLAELSDDDDLITLGLDSIRVMTLVTRWQDAGLPIVFGELFEQPTLRRWSELLAERGAHEPVRTASRAAVDPSAPFPLTPVQHAYWIGRQDGQRLGGVGCHFYAEYDGHGVDPGCLDLAVHALVDRHPMLRSRFLDDGTQQILPSGSRPVGPTVHDLRALSDKDVETRLELVWDELSHRRLDVAAGQVFDLHLSLLPGGRTRLHVSVDLLVADVLSIQLVLSDLAEFYLDPNVPLVELDRDFPQYLADQRGAREEARADARNYWQERLADLPAGPRLPLAVDPDAVARPRFTRRAGEIPEPRWTSLKRWARERGLTPSMVLATAFGEILARWSGQSRFLLNVPVFDRRVTSQGIGHMVADFTNLLLLTVEAPVGQSFADRVRLVQTQFVADVSHAEYSGVELLRDLARVRKDDAVAAPVVFAGNIGGGDLLSARFRDCFGDTTRGISQTPQVWLDHQLSEQDGALRYNWDAVEELFPPGVLDAMFKAYQDLLDWLLRGDWDRDVPDLLPAAQRAVRDQVNGAADTVGGLLHQGFLDWAERDPDRVALVWDDDRHLSFGELERWAARIAGMLATAGVEPGDAVGVTVPKGPGQIAAVFGVLLAGGVYVPVGVDQPPARRERIHRKAGITHVLATARSIAEQAWPDGAVVHPIDDLPAGISPAPRVEVDDTESAYVIFTSGSTGEPKGVEVSHRSAVNTLAEVSGRFGVGPGDRVLAVSAVDFDLSVYDMFGVLAAGGALVLVAEDERREPGRWLELVARHGVTVWNSVPALFDMLLTVAEGSDATPSLRLVLLSGDWVGLDLPGRLAKRWPECALVALGGATEAAVWSNAFEVAEVAPSWTSIPYGFPLRGQRFRVVDARGRDCPDWVAGELWIGGAGVAVGYRGDPELTAQRFVEHAGERWYRTGDLGRYWPDGTLEFLGRVDHQVKIRGHRIELGEVEAAIEAHPGVGDVVVVATGEGAHRRLVAAVVPDFGDGPAAVEAGADPWRAADAVALPARTSTSDPAGSGALAADLVETMLAGQVLAEVFAEPGHRSLDAIARAMGAAPEQRPLLQLWLDWLTARGVLCREEPGWATGPRTAVTDPELLAKLIALADGSPLGGPARHLPRRVEELRAVVRGDLPALALLDDPVLSPEALAELDQHGTDAIADYLADLAEAVGRPVRVAELDGRTGRTAFGLLSRLTPAQIEYTVLDQSAALLADAARRCAEHPHVVGCLPLPGSVVPADLVGRFDLVLADNALHRGRDAGARVRTAAMLLRPNGILLARERTDLGPLALVTAAPLERGFADLDEPRRARRSPLLTVAEWTDLFQAAGLDGITDSVQGADTILLKATRSPVAVPDADTLLDWAARRLPAYMVPERLVHLPTLPLTGNGKLDRAAVVAAVGSVEPKAERHTPPVGAVEELLANLWRELLGTPVVGRDDDFFALGGDSLLATRLVTRLRAVGVSGADLGRLFATPILAEYAEGLAFDGERAAPSSLAADPEHRYDPFPTTDVQQAYFLGRRGDFALGGVGTHYYSEFEHDQVDLDRLEEAWNRLIARHDMLRAVFAADGTQRVLAEVPRFRIRRVAAEPGREEQALDQLRADMSHQVIDPGTWPLFDVRAVATATGTRIGISLDNIVLDGLSMMIVFAELEKLYADLEVELPPVRVSFRDYVLGAGSSTVDNSAAREYWTGRLAELPPGPQLPLATDPARVRRPRFTRRSTRLDAGRWQRIKDRARDHGITPSTALLACYGEVLSAWSARPDLTINLTLFDRAEVHPDINNILGDFTSLLLVAHHPRPGESFLGTARRLQEQSWRDLDHHQVSAVWVMRELTKASGGARTAMPVVFTSALGVGDELAGFGTERFADRVWGISQTPQVWLDQQVYESRGELVVDWDAVEELFPPGVLDAMFAAHAELLDWLAFGDWGQPIPDLLSAAQRSVRERVNTTTPVDSTDLVHSGFLRWAGRDPDRAALLWGEDGRLSYGELRERAARIAAELARSGVLVGEPVGVTVPKGPGQIAAILGVLLAGGVYVPVGIEQPVTRRDRVYAKAGVRVVLAEPPVGIPDPPGGVTIVDVGGCRGETVTASPPEATPDSSAYVIFTSGSTGEPKGVEVSHRSAVNTLAEVSGRFGVGPGDRVLAVSAVDFDLSVYDMFGVLAAGGALVLVAEDERREPRRWLELMARHGVTVWNSVPALFDMLLTVAEGADEETSLRLALLSGDWIGLDLPGRLAKRWPECELVALGGATEAAVWSNAFEVAEVSSSWTSIPYGFPLRGQRFRVVDARGRDCPDWVTGELWIGGAGVAVGYRGDPELTAQRFVEHAGERWYRTGDLGRYWPDGTLEFLGRVDHQVKIRGHRIELGEVEAALDAHPAVRQSVALAVGERTARRLVACLVADPVPGQRELVDFLAGRLAPASIPSSFVLLDAFPLTGNGKVDRAVLARLSEQDQPDHEETEPPAGPVETEFARIWAALLGLPEVGRHQNVFVLGADSLLATRFVETVRQRGGPELSLAHVFEALTVAGLAAAVADHADHIADELMEDGVV